MDGNTKTLIIHPVSAVPGSPVYDKFVLLSKPGMFSVTTFEEIVGTIGQAITDNAPGRGYNRVTNVELATCCFNIETAEIDFVKLRTVQDFVDLANGDTVVAWFQPKISVFVKMYGGVIVDNNTVLQDVVTFGEYIELSVFSPSLVNQLTAAIRRRLLPRLKPHGLTITSLVLSMFSDYQVIGDSVRFAVLGSTDVL